MNPMAQYFQNVDAVLAKASALSERAPTCRKGCHACCSEAVYSTQAEVDYILNVLTYPEKTELKKRLHDWLEKTETIRKVNMPSAMDYRALRVSCPFLQDGLCSIYHRRPMGCREFIAVGPPQDCDLPARAHQKFLQIGENNLGLYEYVGPPPMTVKDGAIAIDHFGVLLAETLWNIHIPSASRKEYSAA